MTFERGGIKNQNKFQFIKIFIQILFVIFLLNQPPKVNGAYLDFIQEYIDLSFEDILQASQNPLNQQQYVYCREHIFYNKEENEPQQILTLGTHCRGVKFRPNSDYFLFIEKNGLLTYSQLQFKWIQEAEWTWRGWNYFWVQEVYATLPSKIQFSSKYGEPRTIFWNNDGSYAVICFDKRLALIQIINKDQIQLLSENFVEDARGGSFIEKDIFWIAQINGNILEYEINSQNEMDFTQKILSMNDDKSYSILIDNKDWCPYQKNFSSYDITITSESNQRLQFYKYNKNSNQITFQFSKQINSISTDSESYYTLEYKGQDRSQIFFNSESYIVLLNGQCPSGYYSNNNYDTCQKCPDRCKTCVVDYSGNPKCCSCSMNYNYSLKLNDCYQCHASCLTCTGPNENECLSCTQLYPYQLGTKCSKSCDSGYFKDSNNKCQQCNPICKTCSSYSICLECNSDKFMYQGNCYILCPQNTFSNNKTCLKCQNDRCDQCNPKNSSQCLTCVSTLFPDQKNPQIKVELLLIDGQCQALQQCIDGYYLQSIRNCSKCNNQKCKSCNSLNSTKCLSCSSPYILLEEDCQSIVGCPDNYYLEENICKRCSNQFCQKCSNSDRNQCTQCNSSFFQIGYQCSNADNCPQGYYNQNKVCLKCSNQSCATCENYWNRSQCSSCGTGYLFIYDKNYCIQTSECPLKYYLSNPNICYPCLNSTCLKCEDMNSQKCTACINGLKFFQNSCLQDCPENTTLINNTCLYQCNIDNCVTCNNINACSQCKQNYILIDNQCQKGLDDCPLGYYLLNYQCQNCNNNCRTCQNKSYYCTSCYYNQVLSDGYCYNYGYLKSGFYLKNNVYKSCHISCAQCLDDSDNCLKCNKNYIYQISNSTSQQFKKCYLYCPYENQVKILQDQQYECIYKSQPKLPSLESTSKNCGKFYFLDKSSNQCKRCQKKCINCTNNTNCNQCSQGYYLQNSECLKCDLNCLSCSGNGLNNCVLFRNTQDISQFSYLKDSDKESDNYKNFLKNFYQSNISYNIYQKWKSLTDNLDFSIDDLSQIKLYSYQFKSMISEQQVNYLKLTDYYGQKIIYLSLILRLQSFEFNSTIGLINPIQLNQYLVNSFDSNYPEKNLILPKLDNFNKNIFYQIQQNQFILYSSSLKRQYKIFINNFNASDLDLILEKLRNSNNKTFYIVQVRNLSQGNPNLINLVLITYYSGDKVLVYDYLGKYQQKYFNLSLSSNSQQNIKIISFQEITIQINLQNIKTIEDTSSCLQPQTQINYVIVNVQQQSISQIQSIFQSCISSYQLAKEIILNPDLNNINNTFNQIIRMKDLQINKIWINTLSNWNIANRITSEIILDKIIACIKKNLQSSLVGILTSQNQWKQNFNDSTKYSKLPLWQQNQYNYQINFGGWLKTQILSTKQTSIFLFE